VDLGEINENGIHCGMSKGSFVRSRWWENRDSGSNEQEQDEEKIATNCKTHGKR
jgi:hypothetical protein